MPMPFETEGVGEGYARNGEVHTRQMTEEEKIKYGMVTPKGESATSLNKVRNLSMRIACKGLNTRWQHYKVDEVKQAWQEGKSVMEIAEEQRRPPIEVIILIYDMAEKDEIDARGRGLLGA